MSKGLQQRDPEQYGLEAKSASIPGLAAREACSYNTARKMAREAKALFKFGGRTFVDLGTFDNWKRSQISEYNGIE